MRHDPALRPSFGEILMALESMRSEASAAKQAGAGSRGCACGGRQ